MFAAIPGDYAEALLSPSDSALLRFREPVLFAARLRYHAADHIHYLTRSSFQPASPQCALRKFRQMLRRASPAQSLPWDKRSAEKRSESQLADYRIVQVELLRQCSRPSTTE